MITYPTTLSETIERMRGKLAKLMPDAEIRFKAEIALEINRLKRERGAVILGHNYMEPALFHSVPDFVGDSLQLSREAAKTEKSPIIFCGVRFMAETAKILNPNKLVLLPAKEAGCSLAGSITAADVRALKDKYPGVPVVTYINTYADVKAESDICVTSGNAVKVVRSLPNKQIIFLPDEFMARNIAREAGKEIIFPFNPGSERPSDIPVMIGWKGRCEVHEKFTLEDITSTRAQFPGVKIITHPEAPPEVVMASDYSGGTTQMVDYVKSTEAPHYLILTECSMADNIIAENPDKDILRMCSVRCPHMNEITLEDTLNALRNNVQVIEVPEDIRIRARRAVDRMLSY